MLSNCVIKTVRQHHFEAPKEDITQEQTPTKMQVDTAHGKQIVSQSAGYPFFITLIYIHTNNHI